MGCSVGDPDRQSMYFPTMTDNDRVMETDVLKREATDWLVHLTSGDVTVADLRALRVWRDQSPSHAEAFAKASQLWRSLGPAVEEAARRQGMDGQVVGNGGRGPLWGRRAALGGMLSAGAAGYLVVQPPLGLWPSASQLLADYRTAIGEQRQIALSDDVSIDLNTASTLNVETSQAVDRIELLSGEAAMAARPEVSKPMVVLAAGGQTSARGASFNLRCMDGVVSVTCLRGTVEVAYRRQRVVLAARQQVSYGRGNLGAAISIDPAVVVAWQQHMLVFQNEPLVRVIDEVNRYRPGKIVLMKSEVANRQVTARFKLDRLDDVVTQVQQVFGLNVRILPGGIVLLT